jgi:zinc and cadmium transporter
VSPIVGTGVAVVGVSALSLLGLLALGTEESRVRALVPLLTSIAAGALVGAATLDLIPETLARNVGWGALVVALGAGFAGFWLLEQVLHTAARIRSREDGGSPSRRRSHPIVTLNFIGDALHNAADGAMIAAAFLGGTRVGVIATLAIVLHEIPRELGSFGIFLHGGLSVRRAAVYNGLTGVAALAGAALTLAIGMRVASAATIILPVAAGTFLFVAGSIVRTTLRSLPSARARVRWLVLAGGAFVATGAASRLG